MTTNRIPVQRPAQTMISHRALDLFIAMGKLCCSCPSPKPVTQSPCRGCDRWYDLHDELHRELGCKLWDWPCVARQKPKGAGSTYVSADITARMAALQQAAARRTAAGGTPDAEPVEDTAI
jgi:hypothetical protein